jgi:thioredoxin 2
MPTTLRSDGQGVIARCPSCGKSNRLRYENLNRTIRCGNCHTNLPPPGEPVDVPDAAAFDTIVQRTPFPVVVDFWAPWCGPCRMMAPELETAARDMAGRALVVKVNTDAVPELGERFSIMSIPTLAVFRQGREISRVSGVRPAADIEALAARS